MKTLVLIRHAKSSWKHPELEDIDRPLKKRGLRDAPLMGKVLKKLKLRPDLIISSPAVRALATAEIMAKKFDYKKKRILTDPKIYLESKSGLLNVINKIDDRFSTVFFVSHNPGITDLANALTGGSVDNIPTSGVFGIKFDCNNWNDVQMEKGKKIFFEIPETHRTKIEENEKPVL